MYDGSMSHTLVFDIETIGENYDDMDETTREVLVRWIKKESKTEEEYQAKLDDLKQGLGFSPLTGEIVAIGMYDLERKKGCVYYQAPHGKEEDSEEGDFKYRVMDEKTMLEEFWRVALEYDTFVTFNGRSFDVPFMMLRSAAHRIRPSKNLCAARYLYQHRDGEAHVDLLEQLTFYGAMNRSGSKSMHLYCRAFGIESPKENGSGDKVAEMFANKEYKKIAIYNGGDVVATGALYEYWKQTLA